MPLREVVELRAFVVRVVVPGHELGKQLGQRLFPGPALLARHGFVALQLLEPAQLEHQGLGIITEIGIVTQQIG